MNLHAHDHQHCDATIPAGEPFLAEVKAGQTVRILDLEGNQAVDTLFFSLANPRERYDVQRTLRRQNSVYLTTGSVLFSNLGQPMLTIVAMTPVAGTTRWAAPVRKKATPCAMPWKNATCTAAATTTCAPACTTVV
ncbi:hypothetical protein CFBP1590__1313 [Pseudomonas viridiflava]|uniref:DUF1989 domain-containing protein n=1 Tax=Pseudomonas viridiflava TaxID=33069 RepID=A0A1Y6JGH3_PSEVI|nr:hypothetical protein CFBP1590__1313 [Pseudomonas viridiflava]